MSLFSSMYQSLTYEGVSSGNITVYDLVRSEMKHMVSMHWAQFPPMNPLWHQILGFTIFVLAIVSMIGNYVVISVFTSTKSLRSPSNLLVVNLAFSDFLMLFTMAPPMIMNCWHETWIFGPLACELYGAAGSLFGCSSIWSMTMIASDRYNVIVKGLSAKPMSKADAIIKILLVWLFSILWTALPFLGWCRYVPEGNMTACGTDYLTNDWNSRSYLLAYSVFVYWLPLFLIIYSYFFILKTVYAHEKSMRAQAKKMNVASLRSTGADNDKKTEYKLAKVALTTISLWFMAWTPYLVINLGSSLNLIQISPLASIWGSIFAKANAVYNPIVYGISHPKYRAALQLKYPRLSCANEQEEVCDNQSMSTAGSTEECTQDRS